MSARFGASRRRAFLAALAQTGNQTLAAEAAKVSRSWVHKHRSAGPEFDMACRAAIAAARSHFEGLAASGEATRKPPARWAWLDGAELVVRGTGGSAPASGGGPLRQAQGGRERGRPQIARARVKQWSPRAEARFLSALTASCNVKLACAEVGLTPASAYNHRHRWAGFARRWDEAVEVGYLQVEAGLIAATGSMFEGEELAEVAPLRAMTFAQAVHLLHMHKHAVRGIGKRPGLPPRQADIEEVRAEILRRVAAIRRVEALGS
ncbi:MAG: hypothetical protein ACKVPY_17670 [Paracoccaceae bacterium]